MLGTSLNYVAARILGMSASDPALVRARAWIRANGGAVTVPSWGKFWLSVLNVYDWSGMMPLQPELWLLPTALPFHPSRFWCHTRMVQLPMSYIYGARITAPINDFIRSLREEIYVTPYESIDWSYARSAICERDNYSPHTRTLEALTLALVGYEKYLALPWLRSKAMSEVAMLVKAEDEATKGICIGPVSKMMNAIVAWHAEGQQSRWFVMHLDRMRDYLWMGKEGVRLTGTNGTQSWDASFMALALVEAGTISLFCLW